jgi:hypothetical protein
MATYVVNPTPHGRVMVHSRLSAHRLDKEEALQLAAELVFYSGSSDDDFAFVLGSLRSRFDQGSKETS